METVQFNGEKPDESLVGSYVPFVPPMVKMISGSNSRPPLLATVDDGSPPFKIDDMPFQFVPSLKLREIGGEWEIETPLSLCHYVKPNKDSMYNIDVCTEVAHTNAKREQHNKFIIDMMRIFMKRNDCGVSGGLITLPPAPEDPIEARLGAIRKLTEDKLDTTRQAIAYCAQFGLYCGRDFEFDKAYEKANDVCYDEIVKSKSGKRNRVRLEGRRPSWWDGMSETDSSGKRVVWKRGQGHTFLTPNVIVAEAPPVELQQIVVVPKDSETIANPFDALFPQPMLMPTIEAAPENVEILKTEQVE